MRKLFLRAMRELCDIAYDTCWYHGWTRAAIHYWDKWFWYTKKIQSIKK